jgi:putative redox protein
MTKFLGNYLGQLRCEVAHLPSGNALQTDAPVDNHGLGQTFSPTDLVATALGTCMVTVMGIKAQSMGLSMEGTSFSLEKIMGSEPRRVAEVRVRICLPESLDAKDRKILESTGLHCPVAKSLHPDLLQSVEFVYG